MLFNSLVNVVDIFDFKYVVFEIVEWFIFVVLV